VNTERQGVTEKDGCVGVNAEFMQRWGKNEGKEINHRTHLRACLKERDSQGHHTIHPTDGVPKEEFEGKRLKRLDILCRGQRDGGKEIERALEI